MTWVQKFRENKKLIKLYNAYLQAVELPFESRLNLITEIGRLNLQNHQIDSYTVKKYNQDSLDSEIHITAKW